jgi:hypothetical protein
MHTTSSKHTSVCCIQHTVAHTTGRYPTHAHQCTENTKHTVSTQTKAYSCATHTLPKFGRVGFCECTTPTPPHLTPIHPPSAARDKGMLVSMTSAISILGLNHNSHKSSSNNSECKREKSRPTTTAPRCPPHNPHPPPKHVKNNTKHRMACHHPVGAWSLTCTQCCTLRSASQQGSPAETHRQVPTCCITLHMFATHTTATHLARVTAVVVSHAIGIRPANCSALSCTSYRTGVLLIS